ncbi:MAG TPA: glycosyltransferase family 4 protein [Mucilaginibacter sp.]|nr:glycosyltransferase family 4 protein [Mucilaginibacter sp.]
MRLAIVTTHPIQYYAPIFKLLHERGNIDIMVFYTWGEQSKQKYDPGFDTTIRWDIPLLEGYAFTWVKNTSTDPGTHHFSGIVNPELIGQVQEWGAEAVLVFGWAWQSHLKVMRFFKGRIPVYFRGDSTLLDERPGLKNLVRSIYLKWVYRHVDHAFYTGSNNQAYFKKYGLTDDQLSFAPHAVDNERFSADRRDEMLQLRHKLGIADDDILVLFAGKLESKKSPQLLLDAFLQLDKKGVHLLFTGNGVLEPQLKAAAVEASGVHFMSFQNQSMMPVIYQASDLFCLPSKGPGETWGLAVNEAMACGKAVLVSDAVGCAADLVKNGINGAIFKHENKEELAAHLDALTQSAKQLSELGKNSANIIRNWNFRSIAEAIEARAATENKR